MTRMVQLISQQRMRIVGCITCFLLLLLPLTSAIFIPGTASSATFFNIHAPSTPSATTVDMCQLYQAKMIQGCAHQVIPPDATPFTITEAMNANEGGWAMQWVSQIDGHALVDPMDAIELLRTNKKSNPTATASTMYTIEVEVQDGPTSFSTSSTSSIDSTSSYNWPSSFDAIFDAENSSFESGSGWNDDAFFVQTNFGACRGQNQPGHLIACASPNSRLDITVAVKNTGTQPWITNLDGTTVGMTMNMHTLDAAVWDNPYVTPMDLEANGFVFETQSAGMMMESETTFTTQNEASESYTHALSQTHVMHYISSSNDVAGTIGCVAPNSTAYYGISLTTPSITGLYTLRFSPNSGCGRLARPLKLNIEVTCSDGLFCNGYERQVNGVCQPPVANQLAACEDNDPCTVDICEEGLGRCRYSLVNTTACAPSVCGGDRCYRSCPFNATCGGDGCGGVCGQCQTGELCSMEQHQCVPSITALSGTCFKPNALNVFSSVGQEDAWKRNPDSFSRGTLDPTTSGQPSELSRQFLHIADFTAGGDEVSPACVSFGSQPDFVYKFVIPENAIINSANATQQTPMQVNLDPDQQAVLKRSGFIGINVQSYGKYNPRIDTVLEIRGTPGIYSTDQTVSNYNTIGNQDPIYSCLDNKVKLNQTHVGIGAGDHLFTLQSSDLERARAYALGEEGSGWNNITSTMKPLKTFSTCGDNGTPPGGLGSSLSVLLPPGTYYLIVSSYPRFSIPEQVQALHDYAAQAPVPGATDAQLKEVEVFVRFLNGYLPDCNNQFCGNDGGGNECGYSCPPDTECSAVTAKCRPKKCVPDCAGRTCGSDGCGGSCGSCSLANIDPTLRSNMPNPLGVPFSEEDVYCVEVRDPSLDATTGMSLGSKVPLGAASCALLPRTCEGARPVCYGIATANGFTAGCPNNTFCSNDCRCLPLNALLPDLIVKFDALVNQISLTSYAFSNRSCSLVEHCISRSGLRKLLRFSVAITNQGYSDLLLGRPKSQPDKFLYSPCHHHYHYHHFADYALIQSGQVKQRGHKQAFCLEDSMQELIGANIPCLAHHTCTEPGIQRGWSDYYGADLDCQWIDVTDMAPGKYLLRVEVNSARELLESTFENNVLTVEIDLPNSP